MRRGHDRVLRLAPKPPRFRASYVDPRLVEAFERGEVVSGRGDPERAVLRLLRR